MLKISVMFAIFFGEFLGIFGELLAAKNKPAVGFAVGLVGWTMLIWGYWIGYKHNGIWQVTATSIGSILIVEPLLIVLMFREMPGRNELIGCILGAAGLIVANIKQ